MKAYQRLYLTTIGKYLPSDFFAQRHIVSVKGICFMGKKLVLVKNERGEWDMPGGKLQTREDPRQALHRELKEELSIEIEIERLVDVVQVRVMDMMNVLVVLYQCRTSCCQDDLLMSHENFDIGVFELEEALLGNLVPEYRPYLEALLVPT
jgi:ADP-ribose pyrophosphatase YjhB (NUDIX family)